VHIFQCIITIYNSIGVELKKLIKIESLRCHCRGGCNCRRGESVGLEVGVVQDMYSGLSIL